MKTLGIFILLCGIVVSASGSGRAAEEGVVPLFDGKSLKGWHALPGGKWEVKDGAILGTSTKEEKRHGLLLSDKTYGDFTIRLKFRVLKGNSGLYFRSERVEHAVGVNGFQAEVANDENVGGLYETGGRAWVVQPDAELIKKTYKPKQWNEMIVSAHGRHIVVHLNGTKTAELKDDPGRLSGHFGLQLHGGQDMEVMFKDIEIIPAAPGAPSDPPTTGERAPTVGTRCTSRTAASSPHAPRGEATRSQCRSSAAS